MSFSIWKKVKKYKRLRGAKDNRLSYDILKDVYKKATPEMRKLYEKEMDDYIKAVESGKIKAGESIIHAH